ncbi:MAG: FAD-dependent oxidoreductase [Hyphomicrobium sp.]|nr:FAD-dependent oxidoreductase [Hyphomicrobium sp.]
MGRRTEYCIRAGWLGEFVLTLRVAVVGAGIAGLSCARELRRAGYFVEVFEEGRIIGGRLATARLGTESFDTGAQYVSGRSTEFRAFLDEMVGLGYAARWMPRTRVGGQEGGGQLNPWFVGTPGMASIVRPLTEGIRVHVNQRVHTIERGDKGWRVWFEDETSVGPFSAVAAAVPAPLARVLLGRVEEFAEPFARVRMAPCWCLSVRLEDRVLPDQDVFSDMNETIRWIARNNSKPGRKSQGESLVIHAAQRFSRETEDMEPQEVAEELWNEVCHALSLPPVRPSRMAAHLWKHGVVDQPLGETYLYSSEKNVGATGDWCLGRLAEHAFESGTKLARAIVSSLD